MTRRAKRGERERESEEIRREERKKHGVAVVAAEFGRKKARGR